MQEHTVFFAAKRDDFLPALRKTIFQNKELFKAHEPFHGYIVLINENKLILPFKTKINRTDYGN